MSTYIKDKIRNDAEKYTNDLRIQDMLVDFAYEQVSSFLTIDVNTVLVIIYEYFEKELHIDVKHIGSKQSYMRMGFVYVVDYFINTYDAKSNYAKELRKFIGKKKHRTKIADFLGYNRTGVNYALKTISEHVSIYSLIRNDINAIIQDLEIRIHF